MTYSYNPRTGFTKQIFDDHLFRVLVFQDSSIRVSGVLEFNKDFNEIIDTSIWTDVIISTRENGDLMLSSADRNIKTKQIVGRTDFKVNPVEYFLKLKERIDTYHIIAIEKHPRVNTVKLVFSDHDYLIYKPDILVFKTDDTDFIKYLFEDSIRLDNNWYQFKTEKKIDYY